MNSGGTLLISQRNQSTTLLFQVQFHETRTQIKMSPHPLAENPPTYTESAQDTLVDEPPRPILQAHLLPQARIFRRIEILPEEPSDLPVYTGTIPPPSPAYIPSRSQTTSPQNQPSPTKPIKAKRVRRKGIKRVFKKVISVAAKTGAAILAAPVLIIAVVIHVVYEGGKIVLRVISIPLWIPICLLACCMEPFDY